MGLQEAFYGVGAAVLLAALIYGVAVAGRRHSSADEDQAARRKMNQPEKIR